MNFGMDMSQILGGLGDGAGQFGLGGYNSPSGMGGGQFGGMGGPSHLSQALGAFGKSMMGRQQGQEGQPEMAQQAQQQPDIQSLLAQLFQERQQGNPVGGQFANYLSQRL